MGGMPIFLLGTLALFCFAFLAVGAVVFVISLADRRMRKLALSAALWCAVWGPCLLAWVSFAVMANFIVDSGLEHLAHGTMRPGQWLAGFGIGLSLLAFLSTAVFATALAWLHQAAIRRMTFALFRIYATLVCAGIGSVFGWGLGIAFAVNDVPNGLPLWIATMPILSAGFGFLGYRLAKQLRGKAPDRFTWVTPEEFDGVPAIAKKFAN
jgi:hypothetical protein